MNIHDTTCVPDVLRKIGFIADEYMFMTFWTLGESILGHIIVTLFTNQMLNCTGKLECFIYPSFLFTNCTFQFWAKKKK